MSMGNLATLVRALGGEFMKNMHLTENPSFLQTLFNEFQKSKKKIKALENFSLTGLFQHKPYLILIKKCMLCCVVGKKEEEFLDYMLGKYNINFLDWSYRTRWVKKQIESKKNKVASKRQEQLFLPLFDHSKITTTTTTNKVPPYLLNTLMRSSFRRSK
jgi:hypothetical protein